jgi:hypothetical protein
MLLETLSLWDMSLTGTLPISLYNLENLKALHLFKNGLWGTIQTDAGMLINLEQFVLNNNPLLSGTNLKVSKVKVFFVHSSKTFLSATGTIPSELGHCVNLSKIRLQCHYLVYTHALPHSSILS